MLFFHIIIKISQKPFFLLNFNQKLTMCYIFLNLGIQSLPKLNTMKKITLVIFMALMSWCGYSQLQLETFDASTSLPPGWQQLNVAGQQQFWRVVAHNPLTTPAYGGSGNVAYLQRENVANGTTSEDWLVTKQFPVPVNGRLHFMSRLTQLGDDGSRYRIMIHTGNTPSDPSTYTEMVPEMGELEMNPDPYQTDYLEKVFPIPASIPVGQNIYIAFVMNGDNGDRWLIDNVKVVQQCFNATGLSASGFGTNSAILNWNNPSNAGVWNIDIVPAASAPTGVGLVYNGFPPYTATTDSNGNPLQPSTQYKYYVKATCTDSGTSSWVGPFAFSTVAVGATCTAPINITALPYSTTDNTSNYGDDIEGTAGATGCNATGQFLNGDEVFYSYTATFTGNVSFSMSNNGVNSGMFIYTSCANVGVSCAAGGVGNATTPVEISSFPVTAGQTYYVAISTSGTTQSTPYTLIIQRVNCAAPVGLPTSGVDGDSANLSWTNPSGASSWEVAVQLAGTGIPAGSGTTASTNTNYNAGGLLDSTSYEYYVRANCGDGTFSAWSGPYGFTTTQVAVNLNYSQNFDGATHGFALSNGTQTNKWVVGTATSASPTRSLYISNDNGATNNFTNGTASVVHAYRDVQMPQSVGEVSLSFDWKGLGESCCDYIRVWIVPASHVPTPGTQITAANSGGVQVGGNFNMQAAWQTANFTLNAAPFAGTVRRLVFEWRNDGSLGTNPAGAVDNINIALVACSAPSALTVGQVSDNSATYSWTAPGLAPSSYDYYYGTVNTAPTAATIPTGNTTSTSVTLNPLTPTTQYFFWVRSNCGPTDGNSAWIGPLSTTTTQVAAPMNFAENFDGTNNWGFTNGTQTNKWVVGTAVSNSPTQSLYVSNNNGAANAYTNNSTSTVQAFRDIQMPATVDQLTLSFDWKGVGESCCDYLRVWLVPSSFTPTAGTQITAANSGGVQIGANHNMQTAWQTATYTVNAAGLGGQIRRLVFEWRNDGSGGTNPPAAVDNINLAVVTCPQPTALTLGAMTENSAVVSWTGPTSATPTFDYYYSTANTAPTASTTPSNNVPGVTTTIGGLNPSTTYYVWVRSNCGSENSVWTGPLSFTTPQIPGTMAYNENFEGPINWTLVNGTQPNKWIVGTATSTSPTHSLYISNNNAANAYTNNSASVVQAYRDVLIADPATQLSLSFDWKALGESCCDYLRVWLVPVTFTPTAGTQITAANSGGIQIGANHNMQADWQTANYTLSAAGLTGQIRRLVFEWRNDGSVGTNPPAAVDNINFKVLTCPAPTNLVLASLGGTNATFTWTAAPYGSTSYDYFLTTTSTPPTEATVPTGNVTGTTVTVPTLPSTAYYFWVRSNCGGGDTSIWLGPNAFNSPQIPAGLDYSMDFEVTEHNWALNNGTQTNKWVVGTATSLSPTRSLYISNDNGATNSYTANSASVVHAYRDLSVPTGANLLEVSFDWKGVAESCCDYLRVWMVPVTFTPTPGTQITAANSGGTQLGANMNQSAAWKHESFEINSTAFDGEVRRLIFEWRNDGSVGTNPPAAVDNVNVNVVLCPKPTDLDISCVSSTGGEITWTPGGSETSWEYVLLPAGSPAPTSGTTTTTPAYTAAGLVAETNYTFYVRAVCGGTNGNSTWAQISFETPDVSIVGAEPFCGSTGSASIIFDNTFGQGAASGYGDVACLGSTPNPVWYYLSVENTGTLDFRIVQNTLFDANGNPIGDGLDVDFAAFGPFLDLEEACDQIALEDCPTCPFSNVGSSFYPFGNIIDCSYSAAPIENFTIPNAQQGQIYAVLITNFDGDQGQIQLQQLPTSTGSTNCNILYDVTLGPDQILCGAADTLITATLTTPGNSQTPSYQWFMDGSTTPFTPTVVNTTLLTQTIRVTEPGVHTYSVVVTVPNAANTTPITDVVTVTLGPEVNIPNPAEVVLCGENGSTEIDLTTLNAAILGTALPADYTVSYFETEADAEDNAGALDLTVPYTTPTRVLYVRITSTLVSACFDVVPLTITVNETAMATIAYANASYCTNAVPAAVTHTGDTGGTYTADAGLTIDAATGEITPATSTAGTYTVTYTIAATASCPEFTTTTQVVIEEAPVATIAYADSPYCNSENTATVTHTGATGGSYSSTAGLVIDPVTGEINLQTSTQGTYTVTYTVPATAACAELQVTTEIIINELATATISYGSVAYCTGGTAATVTHTGALGGMYTTDPAVTIDAATGAINLAASAAGTYTVTYTIAATTSCPEFVTTAQVVIEEAPQATIAYAGTPYCSNGTSATVTLTGTAGGAFTADAGVSIDAATGAIDLTATAPGTYTVTYTIAATASCPALSVTAQVVITELPVAAISYAASPYCTDAGTASVTFTGNTGGTYTGDAGLSIDAVTGEITLASSTPGTHTVTYTIAAANGCPDVVATATVVITKLPSSAFTYEVATICQNLGTNVAPTLDAGAATGVFTTDVAGLSIDAATGVITPGTSTAGTYIVTNTIAAANGCGTVSTSVTIVIDSAPIVTFNYDAPAYCKDASNPAPVLDGVAGTFSSTAGLVIDPSTGVINLAASQPGTYTVTNTIPATTQCPAVATTTVIVTSLPAVAVLQGCDGSAYMLQVNFDGDPVYSADTVTLIWRDAAGTQIGNGSKVEVTLAGNYTVTVIPVGNTDCEVTVTVPVADTTCQVPRGISPNNDGLNDNFDLTSLDVKKLSIFNRYGQEVYTKSNYTNQWVGQTNGGDELPTGTYFYIIERTNGESKTGWVYVNRQE